ncbi:stomatin-like isoform X1 [Pantherophis guttatus]|uniref:Stomatin-like isoform X1 n=1 Tax=Pantherophis guttatus TaxID=94885 RepID=A0ABM3ZHI2_PANGU|nr:stomatin-like isoform X1 [Pantherophis guttatus]
MSVPLKKPEESVASDTFKDPEDNLARGELFLLVLSVLCLLMTFPISLCFCLQVVTEYEEPVIMRFGHIRKNVSRGAGVYFILPCTDTLTKVDMRTKALELPFQEIFTKDPLVIDVDGVVYYRVQDAFLAVTKVSDADVATNLLAKAIMKNTLGTQTLSHLISDREKVAKEIQVLLGNITADWGVTIEHVEIKNVKTRVNVVSPGNVTPQPRPVKEASIFLQDSPVSIQFRCLKADGAHPSPHTSTIIFT